MKTSWIVGLIFVMLVANIFAGIANGSTTIFSTTEGVNVENLTALSSPDIGDIGEGNVFQTVSYYVVGAVSFVPKVAHFFVILANALWWNYPTLFAGSWDILRWLLLRPLSIAMLVTIVIMIRGVHSA